ncbi:MAG: hypothetical protein IT289_13120 [Oligoflexia bacterium]|nr:hypothetical protein [Oligoflexia bacterium]
MRQVSDLISFILGSLKEEDSGRVALYHYLKNFAPATQPISPGLINQFFTDCLQMPYWQERKATLAKDIFECLQRFCAHSGQPLTLDQLYNLPRMQLINVEQAENLYAAVKNYEQGQLKEGENLRLIPDGQCRMVALIKSLNGSLRVRTYSNLSYVQGASLIPIGPDQELFYDAGLELAPTEIQKIRPNPHYQIRFVIQSHGIEAQIVTGTSFRQSQVVKLTGITQDHRLFFALKKLERFYIYRPSDPYYIELINVLDRSIQMIKTSTPGSESFARTAFESGQIAFDQIFPDDKALYSRLRELAKHIKQVAAPEVI